MLIKDIKNISLNDAEKIFKELKISFIIRDGKIKGFTKEN